ncbi:MAG: hydrogenase [Clostridia bacterium]|nr:hydrogenase [Clostridia bacterium]
MESYLNLLSILILVSSFILVANKRINSYIKTFRAQSLLLSMVAAIIGIHNLFSSGSLEVLIVCIITIGVKVLYIPHLLQKTVRKVDYAVEKDFFLNIPISTLISGGLVILTYLVISTIEGLNNTQIKIYLVNSISAVLIGLFFMISRKRAIGQIIGFLVIENGLFTAAILSTEGMPMIVELGIFFDLLTAVMIMGLLVFRINENFDTTDINKLKNLRG